MASKPLTPGRDFMSSNMLARKVVSVTQPSKIPRALSLVKKGNHIGKPNSGSTEPKSIRTKPSQTQSPVVFLEQKKEDAQQDVGFSNANDNQGCPSAKSSLLNTQEKLQRSTKSARIVKPITRPTGHLSKRRSIVPATANSAHKVTYKSQIPVKRFPTIPAGDPIAWLEAREMKLVNSLRDVRQMLEQLREQKNKQTSASNQVSHEHQTSAGTSPSAVYLRPLRQRTSLHSKHFSGSPSL